MKRLFQPIFHSILFSNIFIALCAVAQAMVTFHLLKTPPIATVLILLFTATLALYNFCILIAPIEQPENSPYLKIRWFFKYHKLMTVFTIISALVMVFLFFTVSLPSQIILVVAGIISLLYGLPFLNTRGQKTNLRGIPGLKSVVITLVWVVSVVALPMIEILDKHPGTVSAHDLLVQIVLRCILFAALPIPFDIRDIVQDQQNGLKTLPVILGERRAYLLCQTLLVIYITLLIILKSEGLHSDFFALIIVAFLAGWLLFKSSWKRNEYYYYFYLDGVLILQYVMLLTFSLVKNYVG